jgi:hypothetical protein
VRTINHKVDFAISYAGEDVKIAQEIYARLSELGFTIFFGEAQRHLLVSVDGEIFFERLFEEAKEVIVLISENYKRKEWTRFEWDIIRERDFTRRFIPIRLDKTKILGLPSNILYLSFINENYDEIIRTCVYRLLLFEKENNIHRSTEYEKILKVIQNDSKGALAKAYQLVQDNRKRTPLEDCNLPKENYVPKYEIVKEEWHNFSVVKRRSIKILVLAISFVPFKRPGAAGHL